MSRRSVYLQAPHELIQATIRLPTPRLGDSVSPNPIVTVRNAMDGTIYSYVKSSESLVIVWEFESLTREKAQELEEFIKVYFTEKWRIIDHDDRVYVVRLINLPVEFPTIGNGEYRKAKLEFEGVQIV